MTSFDRVLSAARATKRRIVLPEALDQRILSAAVNALKENLAEPVLIGDPDAINSAAESFKLDIGQIEIINPLDPVHMDAFAEQLIKQRAPRNVPMEKALQAAQNPLTFACLSLTMGMADGCVAGAVTATADVMSNALRYVGKNDNVSVVSSFFIMLLKEQHPVKDVLVLSDCALVIDPSSDELANIAVSTGDSVSNLLGLDPNIGMLSFSTNGSARHASVTKVREATEKAKKLKPEWRIIGDVQLDAAVIPQIQKKKFSEQASDEPCNVLVFPNLDAGNIGYKLIERFGGAQALGPILQGMKHPVNDLSRGCTAEDVTNIIAVTAAQCQS